MTELFDPIKLRSVALANRVVISPMCQYSAVDGNATSWHMAHLSSLALGGAGLLCIEATAVAKEGRITPGCLGLWNDDNETALAEVVKVLRATSGIKLAIQLGHAGRKASSAAPWDGGQLIARDKGGWLPVAPSAVAHKEGEPPPRALTIEDLHGIKQAFVDAAQRAVRLGLDAIELHAAHGYLLHQFLSPISNQRSDEYGGNLENRMRFPLEVFQAVRTAIPDGMALGVRVSATDWVESGPSWTLDQTMEFALRVKQLGCDWIDVSSGGVSPAQRIPVGPGYQVHLAQALKSEVGLPTIAVGLITTAQQAQEVVAEGKADMVALGRAALYDPRWAWHAAAELDAQVEGPSQYWRALPTGKNRVFGETSFGMR